MSQLNFFSHDEFPIRSRLGNWVNGIDLLLRLVKDLLVLADLSRQGATLCEFRNGALAADFAVRPEGDNEVGNWASQCNIMGLLIM